MVRELRAQREVRERVHLPEVVVPVLVLLLLVLHPAEQRARAAAARRRRGHAQLAERGALSAREPLRLAGVLVGRWLLLLLRAIARIIPLRVHPRVHPLLPTHPLALALPDLPQPLLELHPRSEQHPPLPAAMPPHDPAIHRTQQPLLVARDIEHATVDDDLAVEYAQRRAALGCSAARRPASRTR